MAEEKAVRIRIAMVQLSGDQWGTWIADMCWRHTEGKETQGTRGLPERHA